MQARLSQEELSEGSIEAGVRALAPSAPSKAFATLQELLLRKDKLPDPDSTLPLLLKQLAKGGDRDAFAQLTHAVEPGLRARCKDKDLQNPDVARDTKLLNLMVRCHALIDVDAAVAKAEELQMQGVVIEASTYTQLAAKSINAGNFEQADLMLEERDYL